MKRITINLLFFLSLIALSLMTFFAASAQAAPARPAATTSGELFTGTFEGYIYGDDDSRARLTLELDQDGRAVGGDIAIGRGLFIDGGNCGAVEVPAMTHSASGTVPAGSPRRLNAGTDLKVQGITVGIDLDAELSRDGKTIDATGKIDLPWLCGRDPVVTVELTRVD